MKILEMRLLAYGPFSDKIIDLSGGDKGLHVIYGPNEAGKSSALRALRNLIYGIPERSTDDFLHPYSKIRIGAAIQSSRGDVLEFIRRKGRSNTLRSEDDRTVIEESRLGSFLNGVGLDLFVTMFGIDHDDLVSGGKEIISGGGSMGRLIFAAGSGASNLREVQEKLKSEADALFRPSAKKPKINETLSNINKNRKEIRDVQLSGRQWIKHDQSLRRALDHKQAVEKDLAEKKRALHRLERIREAFPVIANRKELINKFEIYASATLLPEKFPKQRSDLFTKLRMAENDRDQALKSLEIIQKDLSELKVSKKLLENSGLIEEIHRDYGSQGKAAGDSIKLQTRLSLLRGEAKEILNSLRDDLTLADAEKLRIKKSEAVRIQDLGTKFERISTRIDAAREAIPKFEHRIAGIAKQLKKIGDPRQINTLKNAISQAEEYGALEKHCCNEQTEISIILKSLNLELGKQNLWSGTMEKLESLPVPLIDTISIFEDKTGAAELDNNSLKKDYEKLEKRLGDIERQIDELRLKQEVPGEEDLKKAREERDAGWLLVSSLLKGKLLQDEKIDSYIKGAPSADTLVEAFEILVRKADEISDRLRREADRVAAKAKLIADQDAYQKQMERLKRSLETSEKAKENIKGEWAQLWQAAEIKAGSPKEMRGWVQNHMALVKKAADIRERKGRADKLQEGIDAQIKRLNKCMDDLSEPRPDDGETLIGLIKRGKMVIESEDDLRRNKDRLEAENEQQKQELAEARERVAASERELSQWQNEWEQAVRVIGLDSGALPVQAKVVMEELNTLFDRLKEAAILQKRIEGINRDADEFTNKVTGLVGAVAKDLADLTAGEATLELNSRLTLARTAQSQRQTLLKQLKQEDDRINKAGIRITTLETRLKGMCTEAGCTSYDDLPGAEERSGTRRRLESELKGLDERLHQLSGGALIDDFIRDAREVDPDSIEGDMGRLTEEIDKLNQEKSELDQTIGSERTELGKMDGSSRAAELAEAIQGHLGRLENNVEQYARLRIAAKILNMAIERYREKNQGPILKKATDLFKLITQGSFEGIRAEFDDNGRPVLVGVRPGGREIVSLNGMSDGTADQLYLALRIAGLQDYLQKNEPIPFIVDDILIKFDDDRAVAALQALARLSEQTQVIFFTHHRHLLELVEKNIESSVLIKHTL
ncbi:MAG: AAA family ATPase [Deltaproteobacteria bacterium]|nr:AAA family ATPase [Deltaproteobacteria bacterium]